MLRLFVPTTRVLTTTTTIASTTTMASRSRTIRGLSLLRRPPPTTTVAAVLSSTRTRNINSAFMSTQVSTLNPTTIVIDDRREEEAKKKTQNQLHPLYPTLFTPYELGNELGILPNRLLMGSMHTGLEGHSMPRPLESMLNYFDPEDNDKPHSHTLDRMALYFRRRALGGVGLMVTGGIAPNYEGWVGPFSAQLTTDQEMEQHKIVTQAVQDVSIPIYGSPTKQTVPSRIILQILHTGRYAYHPMAVSAEHGSKSPISPFKAKGLSTEGIHRTIADFVKTASLARQAGYDGVEIMGSEGYLLSQFLSPRTNSSIKGNGRLDQYGGPSFEDRSRFPLEVVREIRKHLGQDFIIIFRISLLELIDNGMSWLETTTLAKELTQAGVTILNTGIGWHESRIPTISSNVPRGAFVTPTKQLKMELEQHYMYQQVQQPQEELRIPAIVSTNRINAPDTAEEILQDGTSDLISMARPLLADPDFLRKAMQEKAQSINTCIACNQACLDHAFVGKTASCLVNPSACHESELDLHSMMNNTTSDDDRDSPQQHFVLPEKDRLQLGVIGAGPAGIAFACTAAELGHAVTVFERSNKIGGQFHMAKRVPGKEEFYEAIRYWENRLNLQAQEKEGGQHNDLITVGSITVKLNTDMTVEKMATQTTRTKVNTDTVDTDTDHNTDNDDDIQSIDKWIVSTGVIPRDIHIPGAEHWQHTDRVLSYVDVLRHNKPVGKRVAVIGAGGIGFDVAEFLLYAKDTNTNTNTNSGSNSNDDATDNDTDNDSSCPAATVSKEDFWNEWGVDPTQEYRGGLVKKDTDDESSSSSPSSSQSSSQKNHGTNDRSIYLMQRKTGKVGGGLGRTTGWIHRASLKQSNQVTNIAGVQSYDYIDKKTGYLVYTDVKDQQQHVLEVDTIISCAGQLEERTLEQGATSSPVLHHKVYPIGGAYQAGELDAKRAIDMGTRLAHHIHHPEVIPGKHVFHASVGTEEKLFRFLKKWT